MTIDQIICGISKHVGKDGVKTSNILGNLSKKLQSNISKKKFSNKDVSKFEYDKNDTCRQINKVQPTIFKKKDDVDLWVDKKKILEQANQPIIETATENLCVQDSSMNQNI